MPWLRLPTGGTQGYCLLGRDILKVIEPYFLPSASGLNLSLQTLGDHLSIHIHTSLLTDPKAPCDLFVCHSNLYLSFLTLNVLHLSLTLSLSYYSPLTKPSHPISIEQLSVWPGQVMRSFSYVKLGSTMICL